MSKPAPSFSLFQKYNTKFSALPRLPANDCNQSCFKSTILSLAAGLGLISISSSGFQKYNTKFSGPVETQKEINEICFKSTILSLAGF